MKNSKLAQKVQEFFSKLTYRQSMMLLVLVCALAAALVIWFPQGGGEKQVAQKPVEETPVVQKAKIIKAAMDIPNRTFLQEGMLRVEEVDSDAVPDGAVTELNEVIGKPTSTTILKGDVITEKKYYKDLKMLGFSGLIPADCRAMTVPISDITAVAGFLNPGDYVDVMLVNSGDQGAAEGKILLQNVLLLAINRNGNKPDPNAPKPQPQQKDGQDQKDGEQKPQPQQSSVTASPDPMAMATLALTPQEALELAAEAQKGTIYLAMRPFQPSDMFITDTEYKEPGAIAAADAAAAAEIERTKRENEALQQAVDSYRASLEKNSSEYKALVGEYRAALQRAQSQSGAPAMMTQPPAPAAPVEQEQTVEVIRGTERSSVGVR